MAATRINPSNPEIVDPLTESQSEAVRHINGPLLILAGPGSGKTRVITHRIAYMIQQGIAPERIMALTFTNKAADEMQSRLARLAPGQPVEMGTFHRCCARLLRQYARHVGLRENFSIFDTNDSATVVCDAAKLAGVELVSTQPSAIARAISWAKSNLITADQFVARAGDGTGWLVERVYPAYQQLLLRENAVDFDDLLLHVGVLLRENEQLRQALDERFEYILVDEYQDTNTAQYVIARALSRDFPNLAVAGDPDQSIYGWRGANLNNILDFEKSFPNVHVVRLEQNYRSTPNILRAADQLIERNLRRKHKTLFTDRPAGAPVRIVQFGSGRDEALGIARQISEQTAFGGRHLKDFAIFYRINALSRQLENALRQYQIPYQVVKGLEFYQRKEVKDVLAYLHLINNPFHSVALRRVINVPPRKIGKLTIQRLDDYATQFGISLIEACREVSQIESIGKSSKTAVQRFVEMLESCREHATATVEELTRLVLRRTEYREWLESSTLPEDHERITNVDELVTDAHEFDQQHRGEAGLEHFLEERSLVSDADGWESQSDRVSLMTLHAAKGLEFPVVFIVGLEDTMLPYRRRNDDSHDIEEERRLLFVGITRAEDQLLLSHADYRVLQGKRKRMAASEFLFDFDRQEMEIVCLAARESTRRSTEAVSPDMAEDDYLQDDPDHVSFEAPTFGTVVPLKREMVVEHPVYGQGTVVEVSGRGKNRSATIRFFDDGIDRTFRLRHVRLEPVYDAD